MDFDIHDTVGAWVPHGRFIIDGRPGGPLAGLRFGAKDLFDVAGHPTGAGNPTWLATHRVPDRHSPVVAQLLQAGATLAGKLLTDELAYSHCEIVRADHLRKVKDPAQNTTHVCRENLARQAIMSGITPGVPNEVTRDRSRFLCW